MTKPRETFPFNPPIQFEDDWMMGLIDLEVYNSLFSITEKNNKFELYKFPDEKSGGVSYEKVRIEIVKALVISDITGANLQDVIIGPIIIEEYRNQVTKEMKDDKCMLILAMYVDSIFQDFEKFLGTEVHLVEDDIRLVLEYYILQVFSLLIENQVFTLLKIFPKLFSTFFNLNMNYITTRLILNMLTLP